MAVLSLPQRIRRYNAGRLPAVRQQKYAAMRSDFFRFFRATAHLFYEDITRTSFLHDAPSAWICGDVHLENYGSYKGDNRAAYFNITDFDECCLASPLLDITRMMCSIHAAASNLRLSTEQAQELGSCFMHSYIHTLQQGYIRALEGETARGIIKDFLEEVRKRQRKTFLRKRILYNNHSLQLRVDNERTMALSQSKQKEVMTSLKAWAALQENADFFHIHDIARRISGVSSLGLERYVALIEGKGAPDACYILDIKEARASCVVACTPVDQPQWSSNATRVIEIQRRVQFMPPALLGSIDRGAKSFIIREYQPTADTINYHLFIGKHKKLRTMIEDMACAYAWGNLQSSGRQGSATADDFIAFASSYHKKQQTQKALTYYVHSCMQRMHQYYEEYCRAYDTGKL